jgi:2-dehydropantoate 2-reductase
MHEIVALAEKNGIGLPFGIIDESYKKGRDFVYDTRTSFQRDFETTGKPDERDLFGGAILRIGKQLGVETPATQELWDILRKRKPAGLDSQDRSGSAGFSQD